MQVIKRNGKSENVKFDKITARLQKLRYNLYESVDVIDVAQKVIQGIYDGITTTELDNLAAETAASLTTTHPDYSLLASRICISNLHKNTNKNFSKTIKALYNNVNSKTGLPAPLIADDVLQIIEANADELDSAINYDRDFLFDYFGYKTLEKSYLLKINGKIVERPQHMYMRVAIGIHKEDIEAAISTYNSMSLHFYTHASPTLFNAGTPKPQMSSCFLLANKGDSIEGIFSTVKDVANISKWAGGIGLHVHDIRANGSYIKGTSGHSTGLVPWLKIYNETARAVNQGGKRKGAFAIYLEPHHPDIFEFLDLRKNHGKEEMRARDLFYGLWVSDLFMKRVEADENWSLFCPDECPGLSDVYGDKYEALYTNYEQLGKAARTVKAQELWFAILNAQIETGNPYILYKDACNSKSNQKNLGTIKSSNLCTEIIEYSSATETAVCNLASISLPKFVINGKFDFEELGKIAYEITVNLNKVIDNNFYPTEETKVSNFKHRPIGIGVQGLADVYMLLRIPFDGEEAKQLNKDIFETAYFAAMTASKDLAIKYDHYESFEESPLSQGKFQFDLWNQKPSNRYDWQELREAIICGGVRNSLLIAPMPTASTSQILGNNECFTEGTEILTELGWVDFKDINKTTLVAQVDIENLKVSFTNPLSLIKKEIDDNIITIKNSRNRITYETSITKGHDLLIREGKNNWSKIKAGEIKSLKNYNFPVSGIINNIDSSLTDIERFRIATQADATLRLRSGERSGFKSVIFGFTKKRKIDRLDKLLKVCNLKYNVWGKGLYDPNGTKFNVSVPLDLNITKDFDWVDLNKINRKWMSEFIEELSMWDGWTDNGSTRFSTINKKVADKIQAMCAITGYKCRIGLVESKKHKNNIIYQVTITNKQEIGGRSLIKKETPYKGSVYCVSVPTGAIIVRKNNCVTISGNCFEPYTSNIYTRRVLSGEFVVVNKHLVKHLIELGLWNKEMKNKIIEANGSIQYINEIPANVKAIYKTVWEIKQRDLIDMSADRGIYICQSQSLNLFMDSPTLSKLTSMHFYSWKKGLKTGMYYLRTKAAAQAIQFTVEKTAENASEMVSEGAVCTMEDGCISCGS